MSTSEKNFGVTIRFRAPESLKARLLRIASAKVKTLPEIGREACVQYVEKEEAVEKGHAQGEPKEAA